MEILNGRELAAKIKKQVKEEIARLGLTPLQAAREPGLVTGLTPGLAVVLVGNDPASHLYVGLKEKACAEAGIRFEKFLFFATEPQEKIIAKIKELNAREDIHAILVQIPLPSGFNEDEVVGAIAPEKDVDGFHPENLKYYEAQPPQEAEPRIVPGVALGIFELIKTAHPAFRHAVLLANSFTFAAPIEYLLKKAGAETETIIAPENLEEISDKLSQADILVVAIGRAQAVTGEMIKDNAVVIDVGTNRLNGKVVGDVDFESVKEKAGAITPVPGGVGPMTVAMLLKNTVELAKA